MEVIILSIEELANLNFSELSDEQFKEAYNNFSEYSSAIYAHGLLISKEEMNNFLIAQKRFEEEKTVRCFNK